MAQGTVNPLGLLGGRRDRQSGGTGGDASGSSSLRLLLQIGEERTKTVAIPVSEQILIGRNEGEGEQPELDLTRYGAADHGVSRLHAAIRYQDKELFIEDLGSTNGTRINGLAIPANSPIRLRTGDELEFGSLRVCVRVVHSHA